MEVRNNNGGLRLMVKAVIVGKTTVNNKIAWRVCASNDDMQNVGITDVDSKSLLEIMNQLGISDDYNIEVIDESSGNMKIKPKDLKNIHSISDLSKPEFKYVLLGFIRQKKIARVLNVETNVVHLAEFIFVPRIRSMKLKVRIGGNKTESVYCDNIWLLPNGRFDDKHYLYNTHGTGESLDLPQTYCEIIGDEAKDFNTRYYGLTPVQEVDASETDKEAEITGDDKVESCNAPMEIPDEPDKSLNETAETNQNADINPPENILDIKQTDGNTDNFSDTQPEVEVDPELNKFYDSNGNCIDFFGLSAYLDKKKLEELEKNAKRLEDKMKKPSIEVGIAEAFHGVLDSTEKRWVCISKNDLYEELVFSMTERGTIDVPSSLLDQVQYKILRTMDGSSFEFREIGIDKDGVIQYEEVKLTPHYVYLVELYKENWKKYYLMQANNEYKNRLKLQCMSDWVEKTDSLDFSIFTKKYIQWIGRKEYLRVSDWS